MRSGAEYIAALRRDGRQVIVDGVPVDDVTVHPGLAGAIRSIASAYDAAAADPDLQVEDEDGTRTSAGWLVPRTPDDLRRRTRVHRFWAESTFGLMGRTPDHMAALLAAFAGRRDVFDRVGSRLGDRVTAFHRDARRNDWHIAYAVTPPHVDRSTSAHQQPEPFLYPGIVRELDDGIIVRGAQLVATSAAIADWIFISVVAPLQPGDEDYAISVVLPVSAAGVEVHPRTPYTAAGDRRFDRPLASRFDESDSLVVLRDAFVPWEQVFVHRDIELASAQFADTGASVMAGYQGLVRFLVKLEFAAGLAIELAEANGLAGIPPVQAQLGADLATTATAVEGIVRSAAAEAVDHGGLLIPSPRFVAAGASLQRRWAGDVMRTLRELAGGSFVAMPSAASFDAAAETSDLGRYYRSLDRGGRERVALLKVMWDLVGSEFGGRQLQFEMFSTAAQHVADRNAFRAFDWDRGRAHVRRLLADDVDAEH